MMIEILVGFGALVVGGDLIQRRERKRVLDAIAAKVGGTRDTRKSVHFDRAGYHVRFERTKHYFEKKEKPATKITIELVASVPLVMFARRRRRDRELKLLSSRSPVPGMLDVVETGDSDFGKEFLVEGAPQNIVRELLDEATRAFLRRQQDVELAVMKGELVLVLQGWLDDPDAAAAATEVAVGLAERIRDAFRDPETAPYRPLVDDAAKQDNLALQRREVEGFEERRLALVTRKRVQLAVGIALWLGVVAAIKVC
ncbi:MAG TPA: hypothetical protein VF403_20720 [Kofleriaceae bacterium]